MENLISVIIPVYNVRKYLKRALNSICRQTYKNLEIILIDDGSTDKSLDLCKKMAKQDPRIISLHQENGGVSKARNLGLNHAGGGCVLFLDSDDWMPETAIENLNKKMQTSGSDLVCGNYTNVYWSFPKASITSKWGDEVIDLNDSERISEFLPFTFLTVWGKLYKREIIERYALRFDETMTTGEDMNFLLKYVKCCTSVASVSNNVYYWNRIGSETTLSVRYHERINYFHAQNMELRLSLFRGELPEGVQTGILLYFFGAMLCYVQNLQSGEEIGCKIEETYGLFEGYLKRVDLAVVAAREKELAEKYLICQKAIEEHDYRKVYDCLKPRKRRGMKSRLVELWKNVMAPISRILIFRLNLFYHK